MYRLRWYCIEHAVSFYANVVANCSAVILLRNSLRYMVLTDAPIILKYQYPNLFIVDRIMIDNSNVKRKIRVSTKANTNFTKPITLDTVGGDEGSRTPVRKPLTLDFFERSLSFTSPNAWCRTGRPPALAASKSWPNVRQHPAHVHR